MLLRATAKALSSSFSFSTKAQVPLVYSANFPFSSKKSFSDKLKAKKKVHDPSEIKIDTSENQETSKEGFDVHQRDEDAENFIPHNFAVRHLIWPETESSIILLGVDRRDSLHGSFLHGILYFYF